MWKEDEFKDWLRNNLEEELETIRFSAEAKAQLKARAAAHTQAADNLPADAHVAGKNLSWWNRRIALPRAALAAGIIFLLILTGFYAGALFYVTPGEIAAYKADREIVLPRGNTPFGAIQTAVLQGTVQPGKGVGRP